jgi:uncharacterized protein YcnI
MGADVRKFPPMPLAGWCVSLYETGNFQRTWDAEVLADGQPYLGQMFKNSKNVFMHKGVKM